MHYEKFLKKTWKINTIIIKTPPTERSISNQMFCFDFFEDKGRDVIYIFKFNYILDY